MRTEVAMRGPEREDPHSTSEKWLQWAGGQAGWRDREQLPWDSSLRLSDPCPTRLPAFLLIFVISTELSAPEKQAEVSRKPCSTT